MEEPKLTKLVIGMVVTVIGISIMSNILFNWIKGHQLPVKENNDKDYDAQDLQVDEIVIILPQIELGNEVAILAKVSRPEATPGFTTYTIKCQIDGEELYSDLIFFPDSEVDNVWFNYIPSEKGVYNVTILDKNATFEVI